MANIKEQMMQAQQHIKAKEYDKARRILKGINHPKAQEWLTKLDNMTPAPVPVQSKLRWGQMKWVAFVGLLVTLAAVYAYSNQQAEQARDGFDEQVNRQSTQVFETVAATSECWSAEWWEEVEPIVARFLDTAETAIQTPRMSLSPIVRQLEDIQDEFFRTEYPECVEIIWGLLTVGLDSAATGFNDFTEGNDSMAETSFAIANQRLFDAHEELKNITTSVDIRLIQASDRLWGGRTPTRREDTND